MDTKTALEYVAKYDPPIAAACVDLVRVVQDTAEQVGINSAALLDWAIAKLIKSNAEAQGISILQAASELGKAIYAHESVVAMGCSERVPARRPKAEA